MPLNAERTRIVYGVCRECKAIIERQVNPRNPARSKAAMVARDLIPRDLMVEDASRWVVGTCVHHGPQATPFPATFPAARDGD